MLRFVLSSIFILLLLALAACDEFVLYPDADSPAGDTPLAQASRTPLATRLVEPPTIAANIVSDRVAIEARQTAQAEATRGRALQTYATETVQSVNVESMRIEQVAQKTLNAQQARQRDFDLAAQVASAQATANANSTREALAAQATRQFLSEQSVRAANDAQATGVARNAQYARETEFARATATQSVENATATRTRELATAAAHISATSVSATATQQAVAPTQTVVAEQTQNALARLEWDRNLIAAGTIIVFVFEVASGIGLAVVLVWLFIRVVNARIARTRVTNDPIRGPQYLLEGDLLGTKTIVITPSMSLDPAIGVEQIDGKTKVVSGGGDARFAARQTEVQMVAAASQNGRSADMLDKIVQRAEGITRVELGDARAQSLISQNAKAALDGEWKVLNDDVAKAG